MSELAFSMVGRGGTHLVELVLAFFWIVDGRRVAVLCEMASGDETVSAWMGVLVLVSRRYRGRLLTNHCSRGRKPRECSFQRLADARGRLSS